MRPVYTWEYSGTGLHTTNDTVTIGRNNYVNIEVQNLPRSITFKYLYLLMLLGKGRLLTPYRHRSAALPRHPARNVDDLVQIDAVSNPDRFSMYTRSR